MIFRFFLQTGEYDFFVQRLRNAAQALDRQTSLADGAGRTLSLEDGRPRRSRQVHTIETDPGYDPSIETNYLTGDNSRFRLSKSGAFEFTPYIRDKYASNDHQDDKFFLEDHYQDRLRSVVSENKQLIHSQQNKANPSLQLQSPTTNQQYACSNLLNYRQVGKYGGGGGEIMNQTAGSCDNSGDRRYNQLVSQSQTRNQSGLNTQSHASAGAFSSSFKRAFESIDSRHNRHHPATETKKEVFEPQIIDQRQMKKSARSGIERDTAIQAQFQKVKSKMRKRTADPKQAASTGKKSGKKKRAVNILDW